MKTTGRGIRSGVRGDSAQCDVVVIGAGPYGLSAAAYLRAAGVETRVFGEPMAFWQKQMPAGMCLRSNWGASHIADPRAELTLDEYCRQNGNQISKPIPLERFVDYGRWYQRQAVPDVEQRQVRSVEVDGRGFRVLWRTASNSHLGALWSQRESARLRARPAEFASIPSALASHTSEHNDLRKFKGQRVVVIGAGQSALESAALFKEAGIRSR